MGKAGTREKFSLSTEASDTSAVHGVRFLRTLCIKFAVMVRDACLANANPVSSSLVIVIRARRCLMPLLRSACLRRPSAAGPAAARKGTAGQDAALDKDIVTQRKEELKSLVQQHRGRLPPVREDGKLRIFSDCAGVGTELLALFMAGFGSSALISVGGSESDPVKRVLLEQVHRSCGIPYWDRDFAADVLTRDPFSCKPSDIYISGFPCPSWSRLGCRKKLQDKHGRGLAMFGCLKYLCAHRPSLAIFENVADFLKKDNAVALSVFVKALEAMGYVNARKILNTREHGVPQSRHRMYWVAIHRTVQKKPFVFPGTIPCPDLHHYLEKDMIGDLVLDLPQYEAKIKRALLFGRGYIVDVGCSAKFASLMKNVSPCLIRTRCLQRKYYVPKLRRYLLPLETARLQGYPSEMVSFLVKALEQKHPSKTHEKLEDLVAGAMGDSMSCNVVMRVLCRALMSAGLWPKSGCLQNDPWLEASKQSSFPGLVSDKLFAQAQSQRQRAKGSKRKANS